MSPQGLRLLKKTVIGLVFFFILILGYNKITKFKSESPKDTAALSSFSQIDAEFNKRDTNTIVVEQTARRGLVELLHFHAYNHYRANRLRNAIYIWEMAHFIDPNHKVVDLRLKEAREVLDKLVRENIALGAIDFMYLRYERAMDYWTRAANLASDLDENKSKKISSYMAMAKKLSQK